MRDRTPSRPSSPHQPDWRGFLREGTSAIGIPLGDLHVAAFAEYLDALTEWNPRVNLTSITDPGEIAALHFLDSLTCLWATPFVENIRLIDVGSGAGFPGVPIAIVRPDLRVTLLESVRKKCRFLEHIASALALPRCSVDCRRAEDAGRDPELRESFDIATTRAVAELAVAAELCLPLIRPGGIALVMKGPKADEEISRANDALALLGGTLEFARHFDLPSPTGEARRVIIGLRKLRPTSDKYPRSAGIPAKRPLGIDRSKRRG